MPSPRAVLLAGAVAFGVVDVSATFLRSMIPLSLDGPVEAVEVRSEKHPGVDDVHLLRIGGTTHVVDAEVAAAFARGRAVSKAAFSTAMRVDGKEVSLRPSRDARAMLAIAPFLAFVAWAVGRRRRDLSVGDLPAEQSAQERPAP